MKRLIVTVLLCAALCLLTIPVSAAKEIVKPSEALYVSDYADVLSSETEELIVSSVQALKTSCGGEIAVVTIDFLTNGLDSEEYAYEIINQWGVGDKDKQNGCVLLLVVGEGKGWCTAGTGAEAFLPAYRLEQILNDHLWEDFDAGQYDAAVQTTFLALLEQYESYYGIIADSGRDGAVYEDTVQPLPARPKRRSVSFGEFLFVVLLIYAVLNMGGGRARRRRFFRWFVFPTVTNHHHHGGFHNHYSGGNHFGSSHRTGGFGGSRGGFGGGGRSGGSFDGGGGRGGGAGRR